MNIEIMPERNTDYREVERATREAFWNLNFPGCNEHYLVHTMRSHPDFIVDLDYVAICDGKIVGNIMYTKSFLKTETGAITPILTFGPVSVLPEYQRRGIGSRLIETTIEKARQKGFPAIVIWGNPKNYVKYGFTNCKRRNISVIKDKFPTCLLVLELRTNVLGQDFKFFKESEVFHVNEDEFSDFDKQFESKEKSYQYTQEEFNILSRSFVE